MAAAFWDGKSHLPSKIDFRLPLFAGHETQRVAVWHPVLSDKNPFHPVLPNYALAMQSSTLRKTKIISTLGPATDSAEMIAKLLKAGVNVFRLNMSHAPHDWVRRVVKDIRAASAAANCHPAIMMDTQ